jgi:F-type H+-transporting ATPase subunit a
MRLSPDEIVFWQHGFFKLNATIVFTWGLMLAAGRRLKTDHAQAFHGLKRSRWQNLLEIVVTAIEKQIEEVGLSHPAEISGFLGTSSCSSPAPASAPSFPATSRRPVRCRPPAALALCVLVAVPLFGIENQGMAGYLKSYIEPTVIMLPFNIISEISRTLALAVRLFGNMMSGSMIIRHPAHHHALRLSHRHDPARPADRHGAGLHLQHPGRRLHRGRHARPQARISA